SLSTMLRLQAQHDLMLAEMCKRHITLHEIRLLDSEPIDLHDWSQADRLGALGYELTKRYLAQLPELDPNTCTTTHPPLKRLGHMLARGWLHSINAARARFLPSPVEERIQLQPAPIEKPSRVTDPS